MARVEETPWARFCTSVSVPGFQYLTSSVEPRVEKRVTWFVVIVFLSAITAYQLVQIGLGYANNPIRIDIQKSLPPYQQFPSVAICNPTSFRASAVQPKGAMHWALSKIFQQPYDLNTTLLESPEIRQVLDDVNDTRAFLFHAAHQKEDSIVRCTWKLYEECSAVNFTTVATAHGFCYVFNHQQSPQPLSVEGAGRGQGVSVIMNLATYEKMNGDYTSLGAKVFVYPLHWDIPSPIMTELSADTGLHTSIGIAKRQINSIEDDRTCGTQPLVFYEAQNYTRAKCIMELSYWRSYKDCGCWPSVLTDARVRRLHWESKREALQQRLREFFNDTTPTIDERVCKLAKEFACANPVTRQPLHYDLVADCIPRCNQTNYQIVVSSARVAWDQLASRLNSRLEMIYPQMKRAAEASMRYDPAKTGVWVPLFHLYRATVAGNLSTYLSKIRAAIDDVRLRLPSKMGKLSLPLPAFDQNAKVFEDAYLEPLLSATDEQFKRIRGALVGVQSVMRNETLLAYLSGSKQISADEENMLLKLNIFSFQRQTENLKLVHLNALNVIVARVELLRGANQKFAENRYLVIGQDGETLLQKAHKSAVVELADQLDSSIFSFGTDGNKAAGCLYTADKAAKETKTFDLLFCAIAEFSSDSAREQARIVASQTILSIPVGDADADNQRIVCRRLLCEAAKGESCSESKPIRDLPDLAEKIVGAALMTLDTCEARFENETRRRVDDFMRWYRQDHLARFELARKLAEDLQTAYKENLLVEMLQHSADIPETFLTLAKLLNFIKAYENDSARSKRSRRFWSENFTRGLLRSSRYKVEMKSINDKLDKLTVAASRVQSKMAQILKVFTSTLENDRSPAFMHSDSANAWNATLAEERRKPTGLIDVITAKFLFGNSTFERFDVLHTVCDRLVNYMPPLADALEAATFKIYEIANEIRDVAVDFSNGIRAGTDFLNKNFLIVSVYFEEFSVETIQQEYADNPWQIFADLGGISSIWLGCSVVAIFEIIEFCFSQLLAAMLALVPWRSAKMPMKP